LVTVVTVVTVVALVTVVTLVRIGATISRFFSSFTPLFDFCL
jgi:hypothetical protein